MQKYAVYDKEEIKKSIISKLLPLGQVCGILCLCAIQQSVGHIYPQRL